MYFDLLDAVNVDFMVTCIVCIYWLVIRKYSSANLCFTICWPSVANRRRIFFARISMLSPTRADDSVSPSLPATPHWPEQRLTDRAATVRQPANAPLAVARATARSFGPWRRGCATMRHRIRHGARSSGHPCDGASAQRAYCPCMAAFVA